MKRLLFSMIAPALMFSSFANLSYVSAQTSATGNFALEPTSISLSKPVDGWENVSITVAVKNLGDQASVPAFPDGDKAEVSIAEGRVYDATLTQAGRSGIPLPPGMVACGFLNSPDFFEKTEYAVYTRIPQNTTLKTLSVAGFTATDLSGGANAGACRQDPSALPSMSKGAVMGEESGPVYAKLQFRLSKSGQSLRIDLNNLDKFDQFGGDFSVAVGYENGFWAMSFEHFDAGPSQTTSVTLTLPQTKHQVVAIVLGSASFDVAVQTGRTVKTAVKDVGEFGATAVFNQVNHSGVSGHVIVYEYQGYVQFQFVKIKNFKSGLRLQVAAGDCASQDPSTYDWSGAPGPAGTLELEIPDTPETDGSSYGTYGDFVAMLTTPHVVVLVGQSDGGDDQIIACGPLTDNPQPAT